MSRLNPETDVQRLLGLRQPPITIGFLAERAGRAAALGWPGACSGLWLLAAGCGRPAFLYACQRPF